MATAILDRRPIVARRGSPQENGSRLTISVFLMVILVSSLIAAVSNTPAPSDGDVPAKDGPARIAYTPHAPISINGGIDFIQQDMAYGWPGTGFKGNPIILQNYEINASTFGYGIEIWNVNLYFIIRNCYVYGDGAGIDIDLYHCMNATVINNTCTNNRIGIHFGGSDSIFSDNTCSSNEYGMFLSPSNVTLSNNSCSNNRFDGIFLGYSDLLSCGNDNILINNSCSNNSVGIDLSSSSDNTLINNSCSNNSVGIDLSSSYAFRSINNTFNNNILSNNTGLGMMIDSLSSNSRIWNNTFLFNNGSNATYDVSHIQAYDDGTNNSWNSSDGYGNCWSDWLTPDAVPPYGIVDIPYNINGSGGAKDWYPRTIPAPPIPEFSEILVPIVGLMSIALIFGRTRREP